MNRQFDISDEFVEGVGRFIDRRRLLSRGQAVVAAISGGADSVAMLSVLRELAEQRERDYHVTVAHLDHSLRPQSADDANFVSELAEKWRMPCEVKRLDIASEAKKSGESIEACARRMRYEFLAEAAGRAGAAAVAVAHHGDDQAETVLYRIIRGTHLHGLRGMAPARPLAEGVTLIRPMLATRRAEIVAYLLRRGLQWREDPTNVESIYRRNFIRNELLPLMRGKINIRCDEAIVRLADSAAQVDDYLAGKVEEALRQALRTSDDEGGILAVDAKAMAELEPAIRNYALRIMLERAGLPLGGVMTDHLEELSRLIESEYVGTVNLPGGYVARLKGGKLTLGMTSPTETEKENWPAVKLACPGVTTLPDGRAVDCLIVPFDSEEFRRHCLGHAVGVELLDADRIVGRLSCRLRREGDYFQPLGCDGRQTVSDLLTNLKLPDGSRRQVLCICDGEGIVYVYPARIAERVKVVRETRQLIRLEILPAYDE